MRHVLKQNRVHRPQIGALFGRRGAKKGQKLTCLGALQNKGLAPILRAPKRVRDILRGF